MFNLMDPYEVGLDIVLLAIGLLIGLLAILFARDNRFYGLNFIVTLVVGGIGGLVIGRLLIQAGMGKVSTIDAGTYVDAIVGAVILLFVVGFLHEKTAAKSSA